MRNTRVIGFSLPPQTEKKLNKHMEETGKTRSELMREMISNYFEKETTSSKASIQTISDRDMNSILKLYYEMMGMNTKDILVIGLGIIEREGRVLIGQRKRKDRDVKDLTWVFPGGKMASLNFRSDLKKKVREETGLEVEVLDIVHARLIPDSPEKELRIVALYFHCKAKGGKERPGGDLDELKWVDPNTVCKYFTTSTTDEVMNFLGKVREPIF